MIYTVDFRNYVEASNPEQIVEKLRDYDFVNRNRSPRFFYSAVFKRQGQLVNSFRWRFWPGKAKDFIKMMTHSKILTRLHRVFVYGSLRKAFGNHRYLEHSSVITEDDTVIDNVAMYSLGHFPMCVESKGAAVIVESYLVPKAVLQRLDYLEGHPNFYTRKFVISIDGREGYIYMGKEERVSGCEIVQSGDWANRVVENVGN